MGPKLSLAIPRRASSPCAPKVHSGLLPNTARDRPTKNRLCKTIMEMSFGYAHQTRILKKTNADSTEERRKAKKVCGRPRPQSDLVPLTSQVATAAVCWCHKFRYFCRLDTCSSDPVRKWGSSKTLQCVAKRRLRTLRKRWDLSLAT
ncbi:hypothetical protein M514_25568 [Trichuris suis]|uniref:Uncharacterized protein n=1 Tax=Trichuris suis TaxID=68888 RepID=A0A085MYF9_9BILA|nr:hypothetical protein M514_25568 [Trichuris suis]